MPRSPQKPSPAHVLEHLAGSFDAKWRCYRKDLKRCRKKFSQKAVHDSRITTRRLMSTLELLQPFVAKDELKKAFRWLKKYLDSFDEVRDTHVQLTHVKEFKKFSAAPPFQKWLEKRERRFSRRTHKAVKKFDDGKLERYIRPLRKEVRRCRQTVAPTRAFAIILKSVNRMFTEVAQARRRIKSSDTNSIHCTRIPFKHFRYAVEELAPLLSEVTRERCEKMHDYQSRMGEIQDIEIFLEAFDKFTRRKPVDPLAAVRFRSEIKRRQHRLVETFLREANQLDDFQL